MSRFFVSYYSDSSDSEDDDAESYYTQKAKRFESLDINIIKLNPN